MVTFAPIQTLSPILIGDILYPECLNSGWVGCVVVHKLHLGPINVFLPINMPPSEIKIFPVLMNESFPICILLLSKKNGGNIVALSKTTPAFFNVFLTFLSEGVPLFIKEHANFGEYFLRKSE